VFRVSWNLEIGNRSQALLFTLGEGGGSTHEQQRAANFQNTKQNVKCGCTFSSFLLFLFCFALLCLCLGFALLFFVFVIV
jgi:hypothetical protein